MDTRRQEANLLHFVFLSSLGGDHHLISAAFQDTVGDLTDEDDFVSPDLIFTHLNQIYCPMVLVIPAVKQKQSHVSLLPLS